MSKNATKNAAPKVAPHIRWMIRRDMPEVVAIEQGSFANPWSEDDFIRCLRQRNCIGMVAIDPRTESVMGHMVYELHKDRLHLLNIAVKSDCRRMGIGRAMLDKLKGKLCFNRRRRLLLECADWNLRGHLFFRSCGLNATRIIRDWYSENGDGVFDTDAYEFVYDLADDGSRRPTVAEAVL